MKHTGFNNGCYMSVHVEMLIEYDADIPCFARNLNLTVSYLKFVDMYTVRAKAGGDQDDLGFGVV